LWCITAGEELKHFRTLRLSKGSHRIEVSLTVSLIRIVWRIVGVWKIACDISERRQTEAYGELS
jgi:hypothetical protein